jgi:hypothetical protein
MAGVGQPTVERLREFLRGLSPGVRALLIAELEHAILRGDDVAGLELVLIELRRCIRDSQSSSPRLGDDARLFFYPLEPFLVDDALDHKHGGRIARSALAPMWSWLSSTALPDQAKAYSEQVQAALRDNDLDRAHKLAQEFQDAALQRMQDVLAAGETEGKARRRISVQLGSPRAYEDLNTIVSVLKARDAFAKLSAQLPGHIRTLHGNLLDSVKAQLDSLLSSNSDLFQFGLVMVMNRLAAAWQLIRLATKAAGGDAAARIEETPYAVAVTMVLDEIERMVGELSSDLRSGRGVAVAALLRDVHDAVRGLRSELDLQGDSAWAKQLAGIRAGISKLLSSEINLMPGRVRRLMRPRSAKEIAPGSTVDADEVAEAESLIGFVMACRNYAGELAINEITQRSFTELQQCLDVGTKALLDALRTCGDNERPFRQSQVDAAVRFCAKVFGQEYASLLTKAAGVASHVDRKAARA